jgi:hypothetical protein
MRPIARTRGSVPATLGKRGIHRSSINIRRSGCRNGSGRSNRPLTTLKIAVFAPMLSASVRMTVTVNDGLFLSTRAPYRKSRLSSSIAGNVCMALRSSLSRLVLPNCRRAAAAASSRGHSLAHIAIRKERVVSGHFGVEIGIGVSPKETS